MALLQYSGVYIGVIWGLYYIGVYEGLNNPE